MVEMRELRALLSLGAALWATATACVTKDTLLEVEEDAGAGGSAVTSGAAGQGGTSGTASQTTGGAPASGGTGPGSGGRSGGGAGSGGSPETGGTGGGSDAGDGAMSGGPSEGGSGGTLVANGGSGGADAGAGGETCPPGEIWCPGCTVGSGVCAIGCPGSACGPCADVTTLEECEARTDCHSVFQDPGTCGCALLGCCARFWRCADNDLADCEGRSVGCDVATPFCESPAYVVSAAGTCYEGCVDPKDCAPTTATCTPPDASGCYCYSDSDCPDGNHCYSADCANQSPGTCRVAPGTGCFGDADCPFGQTCIGGRPAPCDTTIADAVGTCGVEECPDGDCAGVSGPDCTCLRDDRCLSASALSGSDLCRADDGTCYECR
jgi:hypothetical protein